MLILSTLGWEDYELLDSGNEQRLERFGEFILLRPDPGAIWKPQNEKKFLEADGVFQNNKWVKRKNVPEKWLINYKDLKFYAKLSPFKHTGVFPEQSLHWDFIKKTIHNLSSQPEAGHPLDDNLQPLYPSSNLPAGRQGLQHPTSIIQPNILNLFAYTGISSLAAASASAKVTHVDASYPTIGWAKENQEASGLKNKPIKWILDDAIKFTQREIKRGLRYDGIILDPPSFGHGPKGEVWKFNNSFPKLLKLCREVLSDNPLFIIVNAYAISSSALMLQNILEDYFSDLGGVIESGELALEEKNRGRLLSTGIFARWSASIPRG